jgi:hypothetical protein
MKNAWTFDIQCLVSSDVNLEILQNLLKLASRAGKVYNKSFIVYFSGSDALGSLRSIQPVAYERLTQF